MVPDRRSALPFRQRRHDGCDRRAAGCSGRARPGIYLPSNEGLNRRRILEPAPLPAPPIDAEVVDLNQDGYLDIVALTGGGGLPTTLTIYIGLGSGLYFTDRRSTRPTFLDGMTLLAAGDVNLSVDSTYPDLVLFDSLKGRRSS